MAAPLSAWPWENLGIFKYMLYGPLAAKFLYTWIHEDSLKDLWCLHILLVSALRGLVYQLWSSYNNMLFLTRNRRIKQQGVDFKQIDSEWDWDNFIILQALIASMACLMFPSLDALPLWNSKGFFTSLLLHVIFSEPLYYWAHRLLHGTYLFNHYHSLHHSSPVPHPFTAGHATPLEHLVLCVVIGIPMMGTILMGYGSTSMVYAYVLAFDFLRCLGHSNAEVVPCEIFNKLPFLVYIPPRENGRVPDFVFLAHVVDIMSAMHVPFVFRSFSSTPFSTRMFLLPCWPPAFTIMLMMWAWSKTFLLSFYNLGGCLHQTWVVPRFGFQYFLPFATDGINKHIEEAILRADRMGVKVISLAALNKNEALNGGGTLFVNKHPELKVRVVHGNTLTAAVILNEFRKDVKQVFLTGATSKLGRATALYLCRRRVRVLTWIVGKWITPWEQSWAPSGTHFHQFVVPPILSFRRDCTYGDLAAMRLSLEVQGLGSCEYTMERGVVHACHAGGVVHQLQGWTHHEVGAIDVDRIDLVWDAALKHGLRPVSGVNDSLRQKSVVKKPKGKLKKEGKSKNKGEGERKGGDTNTWEPKVKEIRGFCVSSN
ncbi:hypothetical protein V6N12_025993 [Hibiscus sabdariffa]|uniref:Uncharacterized protein n=1 Tax=Hibiscus sabdariffa TaxID=183260 RepID=A0ABR2DS09_9ROSI